MFFVKEKIMIQLKFSRVRKILALLILSTLAFPAFATSGEKHGGDIWFKNTKKFAPVLFSHDKHVQAGNSCTDCHDKIFKKEMGTTDIGNTMTMRALKKGEFCGSCHDGQKAFSVKTSCKKCHIKP
jgi:c(7)-type cytochrome triheme protein